jgi:hypothetical protein
MSRFESNFFGAFVDQNMEKLVDQARIDFEYPFTAACLNDIKGVEIPPIVRLYIDEDITFRFSFGNVGVLQGLNVFTGEHEGRVRTLISQNMTVVHGVIKYIGCIKKDTIGVSTVIICYFVCTFGGEKARTYRHAEIANV